MAITKEQVSCAIKEVLGDKGYSFSLEINFANDLGLDSIEILSLISDLETKLDVEFETEIYVKMIEENVEQIIDSLVEYLQTA